MKNYILLAIFLSFTQFLFAQTVNDALRYSTLLSGSTARTQGAGGSFGAMGGDFGVLSINPSGLADYRASELVFSLAFNGGNTTSSLAGNSQETKHLAEPTIESLGLIISSNKSQGALLTSNFAIGLQQYNSYSQKFAYSGFSEGSITDRFLELANNDNFLIPFDELDDFEAGLAYDVLAIHDFDDDGKYESDFNPGERVTKSQEVDRSGKINEVTLAWGGKFKNKLNLGVSIGIPFISFEEDKSYFENDTEEEVKYFERLTYLERLSTSGVGINFKVGAGYTIAKLIRLGVAYQSPSFFKLDDNYDAQIEYAFTDNLGSEVFNSASPDGRFNYRLRTPSRITGSIGTLINLEKVKGFFNVDATYVNYGNNKFNLTALADNPSAEIDYQEELNTNINRELQSALNLNVGGEFVYKAFRLRAGVGFLASPYANLSDKEETIYSIGAGIRGDRFFIDLAYQRRKIAGDFSPYLLSDPTQQLEILNESNLSKVNITVGYKI